MVLFSFAFLIWSFEMILFSPFIFINKQNRLQFRIHSFFMMFAFRRLESSFSFFFYSFIHSFGLFGSHQ